jgi:hypothetical protein
MTTQELPPTSTPPRRRLPRWLLPALVAALFVGAAIYFLLPRAPLDWTERHAWNPKPIYETDLKRSLGRRGWRNLPLKLSPDEEAAVTQCVKLMMRLNHSALGPKAGMREPAVRDELGSILRQHPDLFYAEYALGLWHQLHGESSDADRYFKLAYRHAPVVLVQTYQFDDGRPLANTPVGMIDIECNRVENGNLDPHLHLFFPAQTTDDRGRVYLPVYDTVYRVSSMTYPGGYNLTTATLGWFESSKLGLLPPATVEPTTRPAD